MAFSKEGKGTGSTNTSSFTKKRLTFSASTSTATLGLSNIYSFIDPGAASQIFVISKSTYELFSITDPFVFTLVNEQGEAPGNDIRFQAEAFGASAANSVTDFVTFTTVGDNGFKVGSVVDHGNFSHAAYNGIQTVTTIISPNSYQTDIANDVSATGGSTQLSISNNEGAMALQKLEAVTLQVNGTNIYGIGELGTAF